jgi:hypothetical protein
MAPRPTSIYKPTSTLTDMVRRERAKRRRVRPTYRHWVVRGDPQPPPEEFWCVYCCGFFGVPHTHHSKDLDEISCPSVTKALNGEQMCACIECACAKELGRVRRAAKARPR